MTPSMETLFEEYKSLISSTIRKNRRLLAALRLEKEDVEQELAIAMFSAIKRFNPARSKSLATHLRCSLQYAILDMKRKYRPHGVTGIPKDRNPEFFSLDASPNGMPDNLACDDTSVLDISELLNALSEPEKAVIDLKLRGFGLRQNSQREILNTVRGKYIALYENERRTVA